MFDFPNRLKMIRKNKNFTQKQVANFLKIYENSYQMYEYGKREPDYMTLYKLCKYFDVSADYLLGLSDNPNSHKK